MRAMWKQKQYQDYWHSRWHSRLKFRAADCRNLKKIKYNVSHSDMAASHRLGPSQNRSKKTIVCFANKKCAKKDLINRKWLRATPNSAPNYKIFVNKSTTWKINKIVFLCLKHKRTGYIEKTYIKDRMVHISGPEIQRGV